MHYLLLHFLVISLINAALDLNLKFLRILNHKSAFLGCLVNMASTEGCFIPPTPTDFCFLLRPDTRAGPSFEVKGVGPLDEIKPLFCGLKVTGEIVLDDKLMLWLFWLIVGGLGVPGETF